MHHGNGRIGRQFFQIHPTQHTHRRPSLRPLARLHRPSADLAADAAFEVYCRTPVVISPVLRDTSVNDEILLLLWYQPDGLPRANKAYHSFHHMHFGMAVEQEIAMHVVLDCIRWPAVWFLCFSDLRGQEYDGWSRRLDDK
jgi:hypothetical protein